MYALFSIFKKIRLSIEDMSKPQILDNHIGSEYLQGSVVLRGTCSFCNDKATFRQVGVHETSRIGPTIAVRCEGCNSVLGYSASEQKLYPAPQVPGIQGLPDMIKTYYEEGLCCIAANSPNGAVTLFRKTIHALGIHYGIAKANDERDLYAIINEIAKQGHINEKLRKALLGVKDIGNDGAHINENEPTIEQAIALKRLIDAVLNSTVKADQDLEFVREKHPIKSQ